MPPDSFHTKAERRLIERFGGEPRIGYGVDGSINGRPVEVRVAREDDRFRLGKNVHRELMEEGGSYIFDKLGDGKPPRRMSARQVDRMMGPGEWFEDRDYPHKFVETEEVFGGGPGVGLDLDTDTFEVDLSDIP